jgi:hypothetical protein
VVREKAVAEAPRRCQEEGGLEVDVQPEADPEAGGLEVHRRCHEVGPGVVPNRESPSQAVAEEVEVGAAACWRRFRLARG